MSTSPPCLETDDSAKLFDRWLGARPTSSADSDLVSTLLTEALSLFEEDPPAARRCIESARLLIRAPPNEERPKNCRLADWQVRRAKEFICSNLGASLRIEAVAKLVHLSASYFSRSFKSTTGIAYSDYVAGARIDLAKKMLLTTDAPISEVALVCGLADQSHLTRVFSRIVGLPPNTWRRQLLGSELAKDPSGRQSNAAAAPDALVAGDLADHEWENSEALEVQYAAE
ncbi:helix-turn-helix domain-containing protein [Ancylobacter oerskovii]|uniref:Helix-turn-helix domain-containing protein n=1 Tax=Ancylobacter oerskovii TaxID=459519 RepID=A0ABW4Z548_9HYPH|nr:AraC family transcriptional regulator [Ancylobacter oerskovii]MBS7542480.1 helix-turn-helix transcriptional regulator [Ancylobacter oerskovii]